MPVQVDETSGLRYVVKRPAENKVFTVDLAPIMSVGRTIVSVDSVSIAAVGNVATPSAPLNKGATSFSGTLVSVKFSAGDHGEDYEITVHVTDDAGNEPEDDFTVKVRKAGSV